MKKIVFAIAAVVAALTLSSCEKNIIVTPKIDTVIINVPQSQWVYSKVETNNYFYAMADMPEITEDAFDRGLVKVYRVYNYDKTNAAQLEMPYSRPVEQPVEFIDEETGEPFIQWFFFTETVECEIGIGGVTFVYRASDFEYEVVDIPETLRPEAMQFRIVVMH